MPHKFTSARVARFAGRGLRRLKPGPTASVFASALSQARRRRVASSRDRDAVAELYAAIADAERIFGRQLLSRRRRRVVIGWL